MLYSGIDRTVNAMPLNIVLHPGAVSSRAFSSAIGLMLWDGRCLPPVEERGAVRQRSTWRRRRELLAGVDPGGDAHALRPCSIGCLQSQHAGWLRAGVTQGRNIVRFGVQVEPFYQQQPC